MALGNHTKMVPQTRYTLRRNYYYIWWIELIQYKQNMESQEFLNHVISFGLFRFKHLGEIKPDLISDLIMLN